MTHSNDTEFFFVYGTLKEGGPFAPEFDPFRLKSVPAIVEGFDLYNLGRFPGVKPGDGKVVGELHEYCEKNLVRSNMDHIEGFFEEQPERSLFRRERVEVKVAEDRFVAANIYVFNREVGEKAEKIEDGVWDLKKHRR